MPDETLPPDSISPISLQDSASTSPPLSSVLFTLAEDLNDQESLIRGAAFQVATIETKLLNQHQTIVRLGSEASALHEKIVFLESELAKYKPQPEPIPTPMPEPIPTPVPGPKPIPAPIPTPQPLPTPSNLPDVTISLILDGALRSYRPSGAGKKVGSSLRWYKRISDKVGIWLYLTKQTEITICAGQCFYNLLDPKKVPIQDVPHIQSHLTIDIDGVRVYDRDVVLHPHGWHNETFRQLPYPTVDLDKLAIQNLTPHYIPSLTTPTARDLTLMKERRWPWAHFSPVDKSTGLSLPRDPFSEEYGLNAGSWTGGLAWMDGTEAATLSKPDVFAARSNGNPIAWDNVLTTARGMGNYPVHYLDPNTGDPIWPEDTLSLEQPDTKALLVGDNILPHLKLGGRSDSTVNLPIPDTAHMPSVIYFAALATGDGFLLDLQHSWSMVNVLCKTRANGRLWGSVASGQVRAWAWGIRCVLHLYLLSEGERKERTRSWLVRILKAFNDENATVGAKFYRPDALFGTMSTKGTTANPYYRFIRSAEQPTITIWSLAVFSHILHQCLRAGILEAEQALVYSLGVQRGWWQVIRSPFLAPWPNIAVSSTGKWADHEKSTFELATSTTLPISLPDGFYTGVYRSACVAAADLGQQWGRDAVKFIDETLAKTGKVLPPSWAFKAIV